MGAMITSHRRTIGKARIIPKINPPKKAPTNGESIKQMTPRREKMKPDLMAMMAYPTKPRIAPVTEKK